MENTNTKTQGQQSKKRDELLSELDRLEVVEATELQEGVAFHAFKFGI